MNWKLIELEAISRLILESSERELKKDRLPNIMVWQTVNMSGFHWH